MQQGRYLVDVGPRAHDLHPSLAVAFQPELGAGVDLVGRQQFGESLLKGIQCGLSALVFAVVDGPAALAAAAAVVAVCMATVKLVAGRLAPAALASGLTNVLLAVRAAENTAAFEPPKMNGTGMKRDLRRQRAFSPSSRSTRGAPGRLCGN